MKKRYKNMGDGKFEAKRCLEDGQPEERNKIYLIDKKTKEYLHIEDECTFSKLEYKRPKRDEEFCFSIKDYKKGGKIRIYNIVFEIAYIIKLVKEINIFDKFLKNL